MDKNTEVDNKPAASAAFVSKVLRPEKFSIKRIVIIVVVLILIPIIIVAAARLIQDRQKQSRSKNLVNNVTNVTKNYGCRDGVKQLGNVGSQLGNSNQYTNSAKETALNYLVNCELIAGNVKQSLSYANQLDALYVQDGNTQLRQQLAQRINYIKQFEGP